MRPVASSGPLADVVLVELHCLRQRLLDDVEHLDRVIAILDPGPHIPAEESAAAADTTPRPPRRRPRPSPSDQEVIDRYQAGATPPQIAEALGGTPKRIRALLDRHGIERRDDRVGHSGGTADTYTPETVALVRQLYVDQGLSRSAVAHQLDLPHKTVVTIMSRHGIPARQGESGHADGAKGLKQRMADHGITSLQVKAWALEAGRITAIARGLPTAELVEAYLEARATSEERP